MSLNTGFAPIARKDARVLILGSMPSEKSLEKQQYYAHPRNAFWPIMCKLLNAPADLDYASRKRLLIDNRIALWDVLHSCYRPGSLDANIDKDSITCNDFHGFLKEHENISHVILNGGAAEQLFKKHVMKTLDEFDLTYKRMPSTSPAHAAMSTEEKLSAWKIIQKFI